MGNKEYNLIIDVNKLTDLIQLTEEKDVSKIVINALNLYYEVLKFRSKEFKLSLVPFHADTGEIDRSRAPVFLNIDEIS